MSATAQDATPTLQALAPSFRRHLMSANRSPTTVRCYIAALHALSRHLELTGMPVAACRIHREHVESFVVQRMDRVKASSVLVEYRALLVFWKWAVAEDEVPVSPMTRMRPPSVAYTLTGRA